MPRPSDTESSGVKQRKIRDQTARKKYQRSDYEKDR